MYGWFLLILWEQCRLIFDWFFENNVYFDWFFENNVYFDWFFENNVLIDLLRTISFNSLRTMYILIFCYLALMLVELLCLSRIKGILPDFIHRGRSQKLTLEFFASICSFPPRNTFPQRDLAETILLWNKLFLAKSLVSKTLFNTVV